LIYIDIPEDWYGYGEGSPLYLGWGRLRCGKIFNGTLKEFTIKKGMLKKLPSTNFLLAKSVNNIMDRVQIAGRTQG
jgi:hypothetical protein